MSAPGAFQEATQESGAWVAYYGDGSAFVVFGSEIEALRYAIANAMTVKFARFGDPDWQQANR